MYTGEEGGEAGGTVAVSANPPHRMEVGEVRVAEDSDFALLKVINKEQKERKIEKKIKIREFSKNRKKKEVHMVLIYLVGLNPQK